MHSAGVLNMKEIKAVIGKNFGDEGKGRIVDLLCAQAIRAGRTPLVIRHNGGAQAGHTVECESFRFVFHQLGSGSFQGAPVYWSKTFLPDLLKLGEEAKDFQKAMERSGSGFGRGNGFGISRSPSDVSVYADAGCICVTVYDVLLNSLAESLRGEARHGSCGMGIHETVLRRDRDVDGDYTFSLGHLTGKSPRDIEAMLRKIRDGYVPGRIQELFAETQAKAADETSLEWIQLIENDNLLRNTAELMWENFNRYIKIREPGQLLERYDTVIFENAQGLLLDEDNKDYYPHLTPSHTGLYNVVEFLRAAKSDFCHAALEVHYVTRTYVTRHGAGRLDCECRRAELNPQMRDRTNVENRWQGELRYAKHPDLEEFFRPIAGDIAAAKAHGQMPLRLYIDVTHMDETKQKLIFHGGDVSREEFVAGCRKMEALFSLPTIVPLFYSR